MDDWRPLQLGGKSMVLRHSFFVHDLRQTKTEENTRIEQAGGFADKLVFRRPNEAPVVVLQREIHTRCRTPQSFVVFPQLSRGNRTVGLASYIESENLI